MKKMAKLYQLDTKWGCGGVTVVNDIIIASPPIFRKLIGKNINHLTKFYNITYICDIEEGSEGDFF